MNQPTPGTPRLWVANGIGLALVIGGRLHRGWTGGAGEVGYLPVPGAPTARELGRIANHGMQALAGGPTVHKIMRRYGFRGHELHAIARPRPPVRLSALSTEPVLEGALALALRQTQDELFASTVT